MEVFDKIYATGDVSLVVLFVSVGLSLILSMVACYVYRITFTGITYSQTFLISLIMITIVTSVLISVIGNNLARAFSLVGALSIIRYRTAVKDARDTGFIFLCVATGMIIGAGYYALAVGLMGLMSIISIVLHKINFASDMVHRSVIRVTAAVKEASALEASIRDVLKKGFKEISLLEHAMDNVEGKLRLTFVASTLSNRGSVKARAREQAAIQGIESLNGVERVSLETDQIQHNI